MAAYLGKYHVEINSNGYIISRNRNGIMNYEKKKAPTFVNKFGSGDSSYRDATFWQFWANTNWRNGAKQFRADDPGKFWKSSNVDVTQLNEITLSHRLVSVGQLAAGIKVNAIEGWRNSQSWWDANYGYRQQITITAPAATQIPSGFPVKVDIDTAALQTASKVRSDRKDWRIIYFNGTSNVDLTRDYVSTTATYFALQAAIPAGASDSNYYVYYGYSSESTTKQPSTDTEWNAVYGMYGTTPDANSSAIFHFREGSGTTVNDDTTNANNGTLSGSPAWGSDGKYGRYVTFDGTNDRMSFANLALGSFTMEGWVYFNSVGGNQSLASQALDGGGTTSWNFALTGGKIQFSQSGGTSVISTTSPTTGTWYHVAVTSDGSTTKLYINGSLEASATNAALTAATDSYNLGVRHEASYFDYFNGRMQHWRFSNTARTSFPYVVTTEPTLGFGTETTTQPPSSSFDAYAGCDNGKLYKWDGISTWTEEFDTRRIIWYETGNDTDMVVGDTGGTEKAQAQSFQITSQQNIQGIEVYLKKSAGTPGDITVRIETDNAGKPSGTLANANLTGTISAFTTATYGWITLDFATAAALSASTTYWLVLKTAAAANDNNYSWAADGSSPSFSSGSNAASADGGSTWTADTTKDMYFRLMGESTSINDLLVSQVGSTQKLLMATGDISSQTNGNARLYSYDGTSYTLEKVFNTTTEAQITKLAESNGKLYAGVGPQAKIYEGTSPTSWTLSKDINTPQNPGYVYAMFEYNGKFYTGGGSPEFTPTKYYNGFWYVFDFTTWTSLYPFDFTVVRDFAFYDAFLFGATYHGHIYVFDTATLNPLFNFKDDYNYRVSIYAQQLYDDKIYFMLYPQEGTNDTNSEIYVFDRHGMSAAFSVSGVTGYRCASVVNNILLIGTGDDGYVYKLDTDNYVTTGFLQTSYFDANLPSIDKLYNSVEVIHDPLVAGQSVDIYYKFKESDSWTLIGTSNTVGDTSKVISFPSGIYSKQISLKTVLNTSNIAVTPKVTQYVLKYTLYPQRKWLWNMRIRAKEGLQLIDKTSEARSAATIRSDLESAQNGYQLVSFTDIDGTAYTVLFSEIDSASWVVNQDTANEDEIVITLLEA